MRPRSKTARVALKTILVVVLSITSLVLARALVGIEITVDAVPVAKGEVVGDYLELHTLPTWQADGDLRLTFDDGTREDAFARILDGEVVVTTVGFGTESLVEYLRRQGIEGAQVPIESSCEIMGVSHPLFGVFCAAYDPVLRPPDHPEVAGQTCSTCHDTAELEATYGRATGMAPVGTTLPAGHRDVGGMTCSTCHAGAAGGGAPAPGGSTPPPGHRPIGTATCASCHGGTPGDDAGTPILTPPPGHRPIGTATCRSCHGSEGYDDDHDEEDDDDHDADHGDEDDDDEDDD